MVRKDITGCPEHDRRPLRLGCFGRPDTGVGTVAFMSGMGAIGDRTSVFTVASTMDSAMGGMATKAATGEVGISSTTAALTTSESPMFISTTEPSFTTSLSIESAITEAVVASMLVRRANRKGSFESVTFNPPACRCNMSMRPAVTGRSSLLRITDGPPLRPPHAPGSSTATRARHAIRAERQIVTPKIVPLRGRKRTQTEWSIPGGKRPSL